jgi:hypothetical protein
MSKEAFETYLERGPDAVGLSGVKAALRFQYDDPVEVRGPEGPWVLLLALYSLKCL